MGCRESISGNFEFFEWYPKFAIMVPKKTSRPIRMLCRPFPHRKLPFSSILGGVLNPHGRVLNPNANRPTLDLPLEFFVEMFYNTLPVGQKINNQAHCLMSFV